MDEKKMEKPPAMPDAEPVGYEMNADECHKLTSRMTDWCRANPGRDAIAEAASVREHVNEMLKDRAYNHPAPASGNLAAIDADRVIECAEGMSAFTHGSDGFDAYRRKLCRLLGKPEDHISSHRLVIGFPVAVAGQGVVERLDKHFSGAQHMNDIEWQEIRNAITVLPEPSEWATNMIRNGHILGWQPDNVKLDIAAALVAASRATAKEGNNG